MKLVSFSATLAILFLMASCKKDIPGYTSGNEDFDASMSTGKINAGDTAQFNISGNPDFISFYSGELTHQYEYRDRLLTGKMKMKFQSKISALDLSDNKMELMLSNDFNGIYDSSSVANAHWKNMSSLFTFSTTPNTSTSSSVGFYPSGPTIDDYADITDSIMQNHPFYLAFRYKNNVPSSVIYSFKRIGMYNVFDGSGFENAVILDSLRPTSGKFTAVSTGDFNSSWTTSTVTTKFTNALTYPAGANYWYISKGLIATAAPSESPVVIKNITQSPLSNFKYQYTKPGTYKATFVATYSRLNYQQEVVKEFVVEAQ